MNKKKSWIVRIIVLVLVSGMIIGIIISSFSAFGLEPATVNAETTVTTEVLSEGDITKPVNGEIVPDDEQSETLPELWQIILALSVAVAGIFIVSGTLLKSFSKLDRKGLK